MPMTLVMRRSPAPIAIPTSSTVAPRQFVPTRANRRNPLVSACLIVKDELSNLPTCLASLREFVDEIVVYDTGSTDGTQDLARDLGAVVLDGYWDDNFARARNAALGRCRGEWIAWLDADETLVCDDPRALRRLLLDTKPEIDAWSVPIENLTGAGIGAGFIHYAARIFRRTRCEWTGQLHEQITRRTTHGGIHQAVLEAGRIRHTGYLDQVMRTRKKSDRNLRVATQEAAESEGWQRGFALTSLGRSYLTAQRIEEAIAPSLEALELTDSRVTRHLAMRTITESLTLLGRLDEAKQWVDRLRDDSATPVMANFLEVPIALGSGNPDRALELLDAFGDHTADDDGFAYTATMLAPMRAQALAASGRPGEAADTILAILAEEGVIDTHLGTVVDYLRQAGRPLTALAAAIPDTRQPVFLAQILQLQDGPADAALEACFETRPGSAPVLATASILARRLPIERALVWSARLRAAGHDSACPLRFMAADTNAPLVYRGRAAATAVAAFGDKWAEGSFAVILASASEPDRTQIGDEAAALCPPLGEVISSAKPAPTVPTTTRNTVLSPGASSPSPNGCNDSLDISHAGPVVTHAGPTVADAAPSDVPSTPVESNATGTNVPPPGAVVWAGPFLNHSGYGEEARGFLSGLSQRGYTIAAKSTGDESVAFAAGLSTTPDLARLLQRSLSTLPAQSATVVLHVPGHAVSAVENATHTVARTMFETDRIPGDWVPKLNQVDEIWVPTSFNAETFARSGVRVPIHVVPGGVDADLFRPGLPPLDLPCTPGRRYLSVFEWSHRKAPDVLLKAWARAFRPDSAVSLILRCFPRSHFQGNTAAAVEALVDEQLAAFGASRSDVAPIVVVGEPLSPSDMPRLMAAADVYVGVARGEGWGRPLLEAMSCGLTVIGTRWSGNLEFMDDANSLLVDVERLVPIDERMDVAFYRGHRWAEPSVDHLAELLRRTATDSSLVDGVGRKARSDVEARWQWHQVSRAADERLRALGPRHQRHPAVPTGHAPRIRWMGDIYADHSLATVSRELCIQLASDERVHVEARTTEKPPFSADSIRSLRSVRGVGRPAGTGPVAVEVRHRWPPDLSAPTAGALVLVQPWEFGGIPAEWIEPIRHQVDEVWVPTTWVKDCYVRSGILADKVAVVPNGVDTDTFRPDGQRLPLLTDRSVRLLFVGGTINRKGFDVLLDTYLNTFGPEDDVCLVVKPFGGDSVYQGDSMDEQLRAAAADRGSAAIEVVDRRLSRDEMAQLYRACDVLVHPYRGEGFGLPVAEAMACGLPTVITGYGACLDFCDHQTAWLVKARPSPLEVDGFTPGPAGFWWAEPDREHLRETLRHAVHAQAERRTKGEAGRNRIATSFTWAHAAEAAAHRLLAVAERSLRSQEVDAAQPTEALTLIGTDRVGDPARA
ncbi:MAG: glycosyltransferase [Actinomycetota bacterium]|jgi:glycosyltransferase involved in cell wall biosynthesis|nr:glycosyltransferase [Actinomycetota bacterium]